MWLIRLSDDARWWQAEKESFHSTRVAPAFFSLSPFLRGPMRQQSIRTEPNGEIEANRK